MRAAEILEGLRVIVVTHSTGRKDPGKQGNYLKRYGMSSKGLG